MSEEIGIDEKPADWEKFFEDYGGYVVRLGFYDMGDSVSVEDIYQAFKARMSAEN